MTDRGPPYRETLLLFRLNDGDVCSENGEDSPETFLEIVGDWLGLKLAEWMAESGLEAVW